MLACLLCSSSSGGGAGARAAPDGLTRVVVCARRTGQFPTLGFVVARYEAIQAFRPETFFALRMSFQCARRVEAGDAENAGNGGPSELFHFSWTRHRVYDWACAMAVGRRRGVGGADLTPPNSPPRSATNCAWTTPRPRCARSRASPRASGSPCRCPPWSCRSGPASGAGALTPAWPVGPDAPARARVRPACPPRSRCAPPRCCTSAASSRTRARRRSSSPSLSTSARSSTCSAKALAGAGSPRRCWTATASPRRDRARRTTRPTRPSIRSNSCVALAHSARQPPH